MKPSLLVVLSPMVVSLASNSFSNRMCLELKELKKGRGVLDFYEVHSYANPNFGGKYGPHTPMWNGAYTFGLDKPLVIGEFASACSQAKGTQHRMQITDMFNHAYYSGYAGAWTWQALGLNGCSDTLQVEEQGVRWLKGRNDQQKGGLVKIVL